MTKLDTLWVGKYLVRLTFSQTPDWTSFQRGMTAHRASKWLVEQGQEENAAFTFWSDEDYHPGAGFTVTWVFSMTDECVATLFKIRWSHCL